MMDTQRLIALVIFSFSAILLWEAWQKHNAPKVAAPISTVPSQPAPGAGVPAPSIAPAPGSPAPGLTAPAPPPPAAAATQATGDTVVVKTDVFDVDINTQGGDVRRVTMKQVHSALDRKQPLVLMEPNPKHYFVTQSGLLGEGLPTHKSAYDAERRAYALADGQDAVDVRLKARDTGGVEVVKRLRFKRDSYVIEVAYEITNKTEKPLPAHAYFQFLRDGNAPSEEAAQTNAFAGVATFTGPAVYTDTEKFVKVDFGDIAKGKQAHAKKAKDGWVAIIQHYFVSAWLPKHGVEREYFTNKVGDNL